ncbi:Uncharacterized protein TCM_020227 [Theobroma cacao]|uniref:Uncharacterized protein n=1 Tax=Theobroma cacao TaxID=3641 RepID=A0A061EKH2_THECC|nr:Uncharacterized protein TCM_020227 [Theobroma cacao]
MGTGELLVGFGNQATKMVEINQKGPPWSPTPEGLLTATAGKRDEVEERKRVDFQAGVGGVEMTELPLNNPISDQPT